MSPVMNQPSASTAAAVNGGIGVADEAGRARGSRSRPARRRRRRLPSSSTQPHLDARPAGAVGVEALLARIVGVAAGDRRVLGRPEAADDLDPESLGPLRDRGRDRRAAQPDVPHQLVVLGVKSGWSSRLVRKKVEPCRRRGRPPRASPAARRPGPTRRCRWTGRLRSSGPSSPAEHADAVPDRRADEHGPRRHRAASTASWWISPPSRAVRVHDALRVGRRARRVSR